MDAKLLNLATRTRRRDTHRRTRGKMREALPARPREEMDVVAVSTPIVLTTNDDRDNETNRKDDETLERLSRRVDDLDRQIANALESFSTRLSNAKHAVNSDVAKTHALAKRAVDMIETLAATLDEQASDNEARMTAVENLVRSLECNVRDKSASPTAPATPGESTEDRHHNHHTVLQVNPSPNGGLTKGEGRVATTTSSCLHAAATLIRVFGSTAVRVTVSIVALWAFFWLTIIALVLLDDWRLVSNFSDALFVRSRNWRDDILALMN